MNRRDFIRNSLLLSTTMTLADLNKTFSFVRTSETLMPVLFVGHGNPMNAIEDNEYSRSWKKLGLTLPKPIAILCVSAHWLTNGTKVTASPLPKTIHDFGGFPDELFKTQYPAPGSPEFAQQTQVVITNTKTELDYEWGLDHGTWSILLPMYPKADIPVFQLSIDYRQTPQWHFNLGKELFELRKKGVLIIGSGNIVHHLGRIIFNEAAQHDWALEFDATAKKLIDSRDFQSLINYTNLGKAAQLSIPTNDHYLPLLYTLALAGKNEPISYFNEKVTMGSLSMRSLIIG